MIDAQFMPHDRSPWMAYTGSELGKIARASQKDPVIIPIREHPMPGGAQIHMWVAAFDAPGNSYLCWGGNPVPNRIQNPKPNILYICFNAKRLHGLHRFYEAVTGSTPVRHECITLGIHGGGNIKFTVYDLRWHEDKEKKAAEEAQNKREAWREDESAKRGLQATKSTWTPVKK